METPNKNEVKPENLLDELANQLESDAHYKRPIIEKLSNNIANVIKEGIDDQLDLDRYFGKENITEDYIRKQISGQLFEILVKEEYRENLSKKYENAEDLICISDAISEIARRPWEHGNPIEKWERIPDVVYLGITKKGDFIVYSLGEAKVGAIDDGALEQMDRNTGSRKSIEKIIVSINKELSTKSFDNLDLDVKKISDALKGNELNVSKNITLDLLVPSKDENIFAPDLGFKSYEIRERFNHDRDNQNIAVKPSSFTRVEIVKMADVIYREIYD